LSYNYIASILMTHLELYFWKDYHCSIVTICQYNCAQASSLRKIHFHVKSTVFPKPHGALVSISFALSQTPANSTRCHIQTRPLCGVPVYSLDFAGTQCARPQSG